MKCLVPLLASACAGCSLFAPKTDLSSVTVLPYDPVPEACTRAPWPRPKPALVSHDGRMAASEYKRLSYAYDDLSNGYLKCQEWAKRQR